MEKQKVIPRNTRNYIKNIIENAGCIDKSILLEDINADIIEKGESVRKRYDFTDDTKILATLKAYILGNDLVFAEKHGLEEIIKWEQMKF